jgi:thioredoxin reductase
MSLLYNASTVVLRRSVKFFDDHMTVPLINKFYEWNMQFNPREDIKGDMRAIRALNRVTGEESELELKCVFVAIGHDPNTAFLAGSGVNLDEDSYILQDGHSTRTNIPGIFSAGDVADHVYRQAITAAGNGCQAALDAERYIAALEG